MYLYLASDEDIESILEFHNTSKPVLKMLAINLLLRITAHQQHL